MSNSISTLLIRNLRDVFGENDPERRRAAIDEIYTEDVVFYDPSKGVYRGRDEIDRIAGGGFQRSELAGLKLTDATFTDDGLIVLLRYSKTDQEGKGRKVAIPRGAHPDTCPVCSLREWISIAGIDAGALFRGVSMRRRVWDCDR
jgi:hypothetical protein